MTNPKSALVWVAVFALGLTPDAPFWVHFSSLWASSFCRHGRERDLFERQIAYFSSSLAAIMIGDRDAGADIPVGAVNQ